MADDSGGRISIEPLKGVENYLPWAVQMKDLLGEMDIWAYTAGTEVREALTASAWDKKDGKALR